jgi:hypothetical protein
VLGPFEQIKGAVVPTETVEAIDDSVHDGKDQRSAPELGANFESELRMADMKEVDFAAPVATRRSAR